VSDPRFGAEYRPMFMQTEGGAVFKGGPEAAAFMVCRCGAPVKVGMEAAHERLIAHDDEGHRAAQDRLGRTGTAPTTEVRRGDRT
jgi:hypothetical protein